MSKTLIIYHANCIDGSGAALCAFHSFGFDADYFPATHGKYEEFDIETTRGKDVYFLDFCFPKEMMFKIREICENLTILDHHKTAAENLCDVVEGQFIGKFFFDGVFDMNKSGAMLAYEHFKPGNEKINVEVIKRVQDRDLWKFELEGTKEVAALLFSIPQFDINSSVLDWMIYTNRSDINELIELGRPIARQREKDTELGVKRAYPAELGGHKILIANATECFSEIANELAQRATFGATYHEVSDGRMVYSLRSIGDFDVSEIAKIYKGGGHKNAAGFSNFGSVHKRLQ